MPCIAVCTTKLRNHVCICKLRGDFTLSTLHAGVVWFEFDTGAGNRACFDFMHKVQVVCQLVFKCFKHVVTSASTLIMSYNPGSSLEDVVGSNQQALALWRLNKVTANVTLMACFEKYWGKSIKDEESDKSQLTLGDTMDVDSSNISERCQVLDISIKGIKPSKILIRSDYKLIYDQLEDWLNHHSKGMAPSAVITGQPGIGNFSFIASGSH